MNLRRFIASTFLLGLTTCQHDDSQVQAYPRNWPALVVTANGRCQSFSGTYQYMGEWAHPLSNGISAQFAVILRSPRLLGSPRTVRLEYDEDGGQLFASIRGKDLRWPTVAEARLRGAGKAVAGEEEIQVHVKGFECVDGWVTSTTTFDGGGNGESGFTYGKEVCRFARGEDGSLVAEFLADIQNHKLLGVVRTDNHSRIWVRFPEVDAADGN